MTQITEKDNTIAAHAEAATTTGADNIVTAQGYHVPVLLHESIDGLNIQPGGVYVDVTFGGGGHSREILRRLDPTARLFSFDQDADAEGTRDALPPRWPRHAHKTPLPPPPTL